MIRGPVLPQMRETLWALVAGHLEAIETGLVLVGEHLDCNDGQFGVIDGLARDASGAPVLLLLAIDGDSLLTARAIAAVEFLDRIGDALAGAVPEGRFVVGGRPRVMVVGNDAASGSLAALQRFGALPLEICRLVPFRIGNSERFAVRWLAGAGEPPVSANDAAENVQTAFAVPEASRGHWQTLARLCERLDPDVRVDGDRYTRRITWRGWLLGQVVVADGTMLAMGPDGVRHSLHTENDVRAFGDRLLRSYAACAGLALAGTAAPPAARPGRQEPAPPGSHCRSLSTGSGGETLRTSISHACLTADEYRALGGAGRPAGEAAEAGAAMETARAAGAEAAARPAMRPD
ncbi:MAG: hypothetical protein FJ265_04170 [Planctomycetes bacterium]|nr:hypothetical protein [Planctomycetota bacterium]